jgi:hypothetical protein
MFCKISMQIYVHDVFDIKFSSFTCYDTVSTYDITPTSLLINCYDTSNFCQYDIHRYDTLIMASLISFNFMLCQ